MDENTGHEKTYFQGAEVREGRILASNTDRQVEDSYETAYNLGCGKKKWDGWINVDLHSDIADIQCDLRKLELATDSADAVAAIHVLEHFYEWEVYDLLTEWKRVLKPGGKILFTEHGLAPDEGVAKWQRRVEPVWKALAGGCHLTRDTVSLLHEGGFTTEDTETMYLPNTPRIAGFVSWGSARLA